MIKKPKVFWSTFIAFSLIATMDTIQSYNLNKKINASRTQEIIKEKIMQTDESESETEIDKILNYKK